VKVDTFGLKAQCRVVTFDITGRKASATRTSSLLYSVLFVRMHAKKVVTSTVILHHLRSARSLRTTVSTVTVAQLPC